MLKKDLKYLSIIVLCNIFDYYDFLLFAHLGSVITEFFIEGSSSNTLLSLLLFAMPFLSRPIGGFIFGKIADQTNRYYAIQRTVAFASLASFGIAILPSVHEGGLLSSWLFFLLRSLQGVSLGGEYTTAGTLLMEKYQNNKGFISGIFGASSTVGSLIAFFFSWIYINGYLTGEAWRLYFIIGGFGCFVSLWLRKKNIKALYSHQKNSSCAIPHAKPQIFLIFLIGALVSILCFVPMIYVNFYLTKIQLITKDIGLQATLIALVLYILFTPFFGYISDKVGHRRTMLWGTIVAIFSTSIGFYYITKSNLLGQLFLILGASTFSAPSHVVMNECLSHPKKSQTINTAFMAGGSIGGLTPFLSGYIAKAYNIHITPILLIVVFSIISFFALLRSSKKKSTFQ